MTPVSALLHEAKAAYGSANAELLGSLVTRLSEAAAESVAREGELREEISRLKAELSYLRTKVFGATSERQATLEQQAAVANTPLSPVDQDSEDLPDVGEAETKKKKREARQRERQRHGPVSKKTEASPDVTHEIVRHPLPEDLDLVCPLCQGVVADEGLATRAAEIDLLASRVVTREHLLHRGCCGCGALRFTMPPPARGVAKTVFSPRFVAQVIIDKFMAHIPCHRQAKLYALQGLKIHRDRLIGLVLNSWLVLEPLVTRMAELNREQTHRSCDESPVRTVIAGTKETRYLWCLVTDLAVTFSLTPLRNKEVARQIVGEKPGVLTSDRLAIYRRLCENKAEAGCMAHCRRYFWYALPTAGEEAMAVIHIIEDLYAVEREAKDRQLSPTERQALRQEKSAPILERLQTAVSGMDPPPRSRLGTAKSYTLEHWSALTYFLKDGGVEIDNNHTEAQLRGPKLGWKNWLSPQSETGCAAVAGHYSLLATLDLYGMDPSAYLSDVLGKMARGFPPERLDELLPWNWQNPRQVYGPMPAKESIAHHAGADIISLFPIRHRLRKAKAQAFI